MPRIYITTPIYYVNGDPHLGSAYTMLITDTLARYYRARGWDTFFLTGTDEHGDKIEKAAAAAGLSPKALTDQVSASFRAAWDECDITYDHFIRTTDEHHIRYVQEVLARLYDTDDIYFGGYQGLYCFGCERFYTTKELRDGKCPDHLTEPKQIEEETYFFRMSKYQERLIRHLEAHPDFIRPEGFRNEVVAMLREPIGDLSISRPKTRLTWGIEMPFDSRYVTYVWFDALLNYISALKYKGEDVFERFWPEAEHFIGKDILKPHGVFWPTMLMAMGVPLYRHLNVHGFWTVEGQKMSKSLGNVISPLDMKAKIGLDAFRYFLLRESVFGQDADFREDSLHAHYNAELANNIGNLVSRSLAMQDRYFNGVVQPLNDPAPEIDQRLAAAFAQAATEVAQHVANLSLSRALEAVFRATDQANKYITETAPFTLAKDPASLPRVGAILHNLLEALRVSAQLLTPFLPDTCEKIFASLAFPAELKRAYDLPWGKAFAPGHLVQKPQPLFPRLT
ncbi:MAG: methionine--tRNA ligase [Deltaproteobacteria bacterium]|nr:methionine--tRNA ligase [Deltaproteobacteria bacterium]